MLKLIGAILVIGGTTAYAALYREDMKQRLYNTRYLQNIIKLFMSEIRYAKATLPEACCEVAKKVEEPYSETLLLICEIMEANRGVTFDMVWKQEMRKCLKKLPIDKKEQELFLQFSTQTGFADNQMQLQVFAQYAELFAASIQKQENCIENKSRVVMSMGLISGVFLTIALL